MTPQAKARQQIDAQTAYAGWAVQDSMQLNLAAIVGVAEREYPAGSGPADYVLYVNLEAVGVIEAKRDEAGKNTAATETTMYAVANLKRRATYLTTGSKPEKLITPFRPSHYPRFAVTVDMIATGIDIKPTDVGARAG